MDPKQELALAQVEAVVGEWKREEARAADGIFSRKSNAVLVIRNAVEAGVPQATIAERCGWSRQRVHQLVTTGR
jgi:hypothetical protein